MMHKIDVKNLTFSYDEHQDVVKDVSFSVKEGSYTTIIGHNGSGKSTIAKLLCGLLEKKAGEIIIDDKQLNNQNIYEIRKNVGIIFQNPDNQFIGATVTDDIAFGLENHLVAPANMQKIIDEFAQRVGMQEFMESEPTKLSGGQKQRVAIAGVLAMSPSILICDEATSMLDPQGKKEINSLINTIHKENNMTIISITHDMEEVAESDHVIVMDNGIIQMDGKPSEVLLNKEALIKMKLDIPFALKFSHALKLVGVNIKECITMDKVVNEICQLHLKK